jgi:predicted transcriptional regulator
VPTARRQEPKIRELAAEGVKQGEIARRLGISLRSVQRFLRGPVPDRAGMRDAEKADPRQ